MALPVQMAALLVPEPIFEADFVDSSYGFRPGRSAHDGLAEIRQHLQAGRREIYDADLQGYLDTIPHDQLLKCLRMRVVERSVLALIHAWPHAPVVETDDGGRPTVTRPRQGAPQGGVISPLPANIYLHWFEMAFYSPHGPASWAQARIVRYADDFVILAPQLSDGDGTTESIAAGAAVCHGGAVAPLAGASVLQGPQRAARRSRFRPLDRSRCQAYYAQVETRGQRSIPPGVHFRMLLVGDFEGIDSQRGIAWRCSDSLSIREFLGLTLNEACPEHSTLSLTRRRLPAEVFEEVFQFVLKIASE